VFKVLRILALVSLFLLGLAAAQDPDLDLPCHPSLITKKVETKTGSGTPSPSPSPRPGQDPTEPLDTPVGPPEKPVVVLPIDPPPPQEDPKDEPVYFFGEELRSETSSVIFVIDISGSMQQSAYTIENGYSNPPKIVPAKRELRSAIRALPKHWTFDIVAYDDNTFLWRSEMTLASDEAKASAEAWVEALQPFGATGTGPAVSLALALDRENQYLVLLTDGERP
jgi:hypothetical protein